MFGVLDKYIGRTIILSILMTFLVFTSLSGLIKFVEQLRKVGEGNYTVFGAGIFTIFTIPKDLEIFSPMAALLGTLLALGTLSSRSELVVMQAAGFSPLKIASSVMKTTIPLIFIILIFSEWISPAAEQWARNYRTEKIMGKSLLMTTSSLWNKDGNNFIHIQQIIDKTKIKKIYIYKFDQENKLKSIIFADSGRYNTVTNNWQLVQVYQLLFNNKKEITSSYSVGMNWKTDLNPEKLDIVALSPDSLAIRGLYTYIKYLKSSKQESSIYQLSMWKKVLSPFSIAVMILTAMSFIFGPLRNVSMGIRLIIGISSGFIFYSINEGFGNVSLIYGIPALIAAISPSLIFIGLSLFFLLIYPEG